VSIRRLFWLGAAVLFSIAALVAIAAVLGANFGTTEWRILGTCGLAFAFGSVCLAGVACLDRGIVRPAAWAAIVLGVASFGLWVFGIWTERGGSGYWQTGGVLSAWLVVAVFVTTTLLEAAENNRFRFELGGLPLVGAVAALSLCFGGSRLGGGLLGGPGGEGDGSPREALAVDDEPPGEPARGLELQGAEVDGHRDVDG